MRVDINTLSGFAFCPFYTQQPVPQTPPLPELLLGVKQMVTYIYSRQMEVGYKISWEEVQNAWNRLWWRHRSLEDRQARKESNQGLLRLYQVYQFYHDDPRQPVAVNFPYQLEIASHILLGQTTLVLAHSQDPHRVTIMEVGLPVTVMEMTRNLHLRAAGLMVQQSLGHPPDSLEVMYFDARHNLSFTRLHPPAAFQENTYKMLAALIYSMEKQLRYPNLWSCPHCELRNKCIV